MENLITLFIALTGAAVLLQAGLLAAMYLALRKTSARLEDMASDVKTRVLPTIEDVRTKLLPTIEDAQHVFTELRPKLGSITGKVEAIADNMSNATSTLRAQVQRIDATVSDVVDRARLQVIRADDLVTRTMDSVEHTSEVVHKTVVSPVRQVSGIIRGVTTGIEVLIGSRNRGNGRHRETRRSAPQDEMFI